MIKKQCLGVITALLLGSATFIGGCATTGAEKAAKATASMQTVENDYRQANNQVDATTAALQELIKPGQTDLHKSYDNYKKQVAMMDRQGAQAVRHSDEMNSRGKAYFTEWEKTGTKYTNPEIRELSEQRRTEMTQIFNKIPEASIGVKGSMRAYITELKEIQTYLSNDLTPKGIEAINPIAQKAITDGENLKASVRPVLAAIQNVRTEMAQGGSSGSGAAAGGGAQGPSTQPQQKDNTNLEEE